MIGKTISHYRIVSQLGVGGMGVVYAAEDTRLGRSVALKFVPEDLARDTQAIERLKSEARTASALNHANICTIYDIDEHDGRPFIVMELLQGQTLRDRLASGPLRVHEIVNVGIQVADALDSAHRRHVIHRDIKPPNLFLIDRGQVKILDFGLAKLAPRHPAVASGSATTDLTVEGVTLGTVAYMSPEQVTGEQLDTRTDLFSFGVVLYECVTGHQPFRGKTTGMVFSAILNRAPVAPVVFNPEMPIRLQEIINNCLEKDRELRYPDAAALRADLMRLKRDLESGRSGIVRIPGGTTASRTPPADATYSDVVHEEDSPVGALPRRGSGSAGSIAPRKRSGRAVAAAVALVAVLVAAAFAYLLWLRPSASVTTMAARTALPDQRALDLATSSLNARNYRTALSSAEDVLRTSPDQPDAIRVRDQARAMIARFDDAIARGNRLLAGGDTEGVAAALDEARAIDPAAPAIAELSAKLVRTYQTQAEAGRKLREPRVDSREPRPAATAPSVAAPTGRSARSSASTGAVATSSDTTSPVPLPPPASAAPPPVAAPSASSQPQVASSQVTAPAASAPTGAGVSTASSASAASPASSPAGQPGSIRPEPPATAREPATTYHEQRPAPPVEDDDAAIRRAVATYARAIEQKDLRLFRSVKPNLSPEEQRGLEEGFRAVSSQRVAITILSIERRDDGQQASVLLHRRDTIQAAGRQQTTDTQQTLTLTRTAAGWVIREIGR